MAKPYLLKPTFDKKHNKWRLNLPAAISPSGKRERHLFEKHHEALAEANKIRTTFHDFGRSIKMLPANRLVEAIECWEKLDEVSGREAPSGSLRNIVLREIKVRKERAKSISLNGLFDLYLAKLKRNACSEHYVKAFKWLRNMFKEFLEGKVSDLKATDVKYAFEELPSGQFNAQLRLIRAVFNYGVKIGYLKSNPALDLEFVHRPKVEVKPLPNEIVRGMLNDTATNPQRIELLPYLALGFGTGCREAELYKILWSDVFLAESRLLIRANVLKTKRKRYIEIPANCREWLRLYLSQTTVQPEERIMRSFTPSKLRDARAANYKAAGGIGQEPQNSKRRTCASNHIALYEDYDKLSLQLGHTHSAMSLQYVGGVTKQQATEYFNIRPSA